jgi:anti-sigma factor RsiW
MQLFSVAGSDHDRVQTLLPWYVTGSLEASERTDVEAHLAACPGCQADLAFERRLASEVADMPVEAAQGWARLLPRLEAESRRRNLGGRIGEAWAEVRRGWRERPAWAVPALAAQLGLVGVFAALALTPRQAPERYMALSASKPVPPANVIVIFKPETPEANLRAMLRDADARLVGGPTAADAYLLQVPAETRAASLARLKASGQVALAEPVDAPPQ